MINGLAHQRSERSVLSNPLLAIAPTVVCNFNQDRNTFMRFKKIVFTLMVIFPALSFAQEIPRDKMVEDFTQLSSIVNDFYRAKPLVEKRTQSNISGQLNSLLKACDTIQTKEEFADLIRMALNVFNDKHTAFANGSTIKMYLSRFPSVANFGGITLSDTLFADYFFNLSNSIMPQMKTGIRSKYINGHYYNVRAFNYQGMSVKAGEEITAINHIPISDYVRQNKFKLFNLAWDENNQQWYSELFWLNKYVIDNEIFILTIGNKDVTLSCNEKVNLTQEIKQFSTSPLVIAFDSILYVRMPIMYNGQWFAEQIISNYNNDIIKIIIDIRGNNGGQDKAWKEVLSSIINEPITIKSHILMNDNEAVKKVLPLYNLEAPQVLNTDTILPSDNNINFKGDIYILQDSETYSAASSLTSIAFQHKNIISVGQPSPYISGRGLTPLIFKLNHSGIVFRMPFTIDLSGEKANPYMNKVEIELQQSIGEYLTKTTINPYDIDFIKNNDTMINYIKKQ